MNRKAMMVGDRKFDVEGAKAYHIASVGVAYGYALPGELSRAGADVIAETVEELGEILLKGEEMQDGAERDE